MPAYRAPRGTRDLLPDERPAWERLETIARDLARRYGYASMETPLFEQSDVFERGIGAATDVVEKELFRVSPSRAEDAERWALRPEATAGIVRAYVQHGLQTWPQPVRVSLLGPMFRYDRPQAGRFRQFWQWDIEAIGDPGPAVDAEIIELGHRFYREAGLSDVEVLLNSIGDPACRPAYLDAVRAHFAPHADRLMGVERERLATNPLRLLDSKDPDIADLIATAPDIADHLCTACAGHFAAVRAHLTVLGVPHRRERGLVRGLDYYTRTTFEVTHGALGAQNSILGGGRYDGLAESLGSRVAAPGIGFSIGEDRLVLAIEEHVKAEELARLDVFLIALGDAALKHAALLARDLRASGVSVELSADHKVKRAMETANKLNARYALILGDNEIAAGVYALKDMAAGVQRNVSKSELLSAFIA